VTAGAHSPSTRERSSGHIDGFPFFADITGRRREVKPVRSHLADLPSRPACAGRGMYPMRQSWAVWPRYADQQARPPLRCAGVGRWCWPGSPQTARSESWSPPMTLWRSRAGAVCGVLGARATAMIGLPAARNYVGAHRVDAVCCRWIGLDLRADRCGQGRRSAASLPPRCAKRGNGP
jgi:hypothetical protein